MTPEIDLSKEMVKVKQERTLDILIVMSSQLATIEGYLKGSTEMIALRLNEIDSRLEQLELRLPRRKK